MYNFVYEMLRKKTLQTKNLASFLHNELNQFAAAAT